MKDEKQNTNVLAAKALLILREDPILLWSKQCVTNVLSSEVLRRIVTIGRY